VTSKRIGLAGRRDASAALSVLTCVLVIVPPWVEVPAASLPSAPVAPVGSLVVVPKSPGSFREGARHDPGATPTAGGVVTATGAEPITGHRRGRLAGPGDPALIDEPGGDDERDRHDS
jgi:hypothetical protein